jgi:hypothetical protein
MRWMLLVGLVFGCAWTNNRAGQEWGDAIDKSVRRYSAAASQVQLGDARARVESILNPTQQGLAADESKPAESFVRDGVRTDVLYYRSRRQSDGLTTDDEFTPYVFENGKLVAIGWATLGGPKTQGQTTPETSVRIVNTVSH